MMPKSADALRAWQSGFSNLRLHERPMIGITRQKPKILATHRYLFSVNALNPGAALIADVFI